MPRSSELYECVVHGCRERGSPSMFFCRAHFYSLPEDLRERVKWAVREGDEDDREAAVVAALDALP